MTNNFEIVGSSKKIKSLLDIARRVSSADVTVLITGESGTGKELFARYIHNNSSRANGNFVSINCAAIPDNLLENELFGHFKGAYTDAREDFAGKFGYAHNGTIFFDEIAEMTPVLQAKILRVIQFKEYEPIGGNVVFKSDVRIIAATNKDLKLMVKEGGFREDLFYRLNVVPLSIPPLRERPEDIAELAGYFLKKYDSTGNKNISVDSMDILKSYGWPGNVRELQNLIERSVVTGNGEIIDLNDIGSDFEKMKSGYGKNTSFKEAIIEFKREFIIKSLDNNNWNQTKTAKVLKIQRTYLAKLIKELKIEKI
jgi:Nif-specific regulatory protein